MIVLPAIAQHKLNVVTENWPPYNYAQENGEVAGIATKVVKEILEEAKLGYDIQVFPWARSYKLAQNQPNTLIYSIFRTPEREPYFHWFCPLIPDLNMHFFALTESNINPILTLDKTTELRIGVVREDFPYQVLKSNGLSEGKQLYLSSSDEVNLKRLLAGEVDVVPTSKRSMKSRLTAMGLDFSKVKPVYQLLSSKSTPICMAVSKKTDPQMVSQIRQAFNSIIQK